MHSQLLGERLNVGILFYFPTQRQLIFRPFPRFKKFKSLYPGFPVESVSKYLLEIEAGTRQSGRRFTQVEATENFDRILESNLLTVESAPFQFTKSKTAVLYSTSIEKIVADYCHIYERDSERTSDFKLDELKKDSPIRKFKGYLENVFPEFARPFLPVKPIKNDKVTFKPDLIWKNGTTNLVKEIIIPKSEGRLLDNVLLLNKKADYLNGIALQSNLRFDFLVQKPIEDSQNHGYLNALEILNEIKAPKKVVTENNLEDYSRSAAEDIKHHLSS